LITNELQYRVTKSQLGILKAALDAFDLKEATARTGSPVLAHAEREALESQATDLAEEIGEYEALKSGAVGTLEAHSLEQLPEVLIKARIAKGLTQRQLAEALDLKEQQIQRYEAENYASAKLERLVAVAKALDLELSEIAELQAGFKSEDAAKKACRIDWAMFPVREMYRKGWFEGFVGTVDEALDDPEQLVRPFVESVMPEPAPALLRSRVRAGSTTNPYALLAWQCRVLKIASARSLRGNYRRSAIDERWLEGLVRLSRYDDGPRRAVEYLRKFGIDLVIEPRLEHACIDGAALLLRERPVIGLTLRYDRLDNFWFTLLHEIAHVIKHLRKKQVEDVFDDLDTKTDKVNAEVSQLEKEADALAGNALVSDDAWHKALARYLQTEESVLQLADELRVSPAIVAGRIRREADNYAILADMVGQGEVRKLFEEVKFGQ